MILHPVYRGQYINPAHPLAKNLLIAYLPATLHNADGGDKWFDSARALPTNNRRCDITGGNFALVPGPPEIGQVLDGSSAVRGTDYIRTAGDFNYMRADTLKLGFTIIQWIYPPATMDQTDVSILRSGDGQFGINNGFSLFSTQFSGSWDTSKYRLRYKPAGGAIDTPFSYIGAETWYCVAASLTIGGRVRLWIDGQFDHDSVKDAPSQHDQDDPLYIASRRTDTGHSTGIWSGRLGPTFVWNRPLGSGEVQAISDDYGRIFGTEIRVAYFPLPEIPTGDVELAGAVAATSTITGDLVADLTLAGAAAGQSTAAGVMAADRSLIGSVAAVSTAAGDLVLETSLVGSLAAAATAAGALSLDASLAGAVTALATVDGGLSLDQSLAGAIAAQAAVDGSLTISGVVDLEGAIAGVSAVDGALSVEKVLAGSAAGVSTAAGALTVEAVIELEGAANAVATIQGVLSVDVALEGAAAAVSTAAADLTVDVGDITLEGTVAGVSVVAGELVIELELTGTIAGQSVVSGALTVVGISTLGTVVDTSIESLTPARTIVSITPRRTIHSIRDGVAID